MENKTIIYLLAFCCIGAAASCKKDYLNKVASDNVQVEEVFSTITNAEKFVNNIYTSLPSWDYSNGNSYTISSGTDEGKQIWANGFQIFNTGSWNPSSFFPISIDWFNYYEGIRECNTFLKYYDLIPADPSHPAWKPRLKGEVFTLRAYFYSHLFKEWGTIPLLSTPVSPYGSESDLYYPRSSYEDVIKFVNSDLDSAAGALPFAYSDVTLLGRATKMVGLAIKSRMLLYYASPLFNPQNDPTRWQTAASVAKEALDDALANGYVLNSNYANVFLDYNNQEVIWNRPMGSGAIDQVMVSLGNGGWGNSGPIQEFVDAYEMAATGLPITNPASGFNPKRPYVGRDPRFYATVLYPLEWWTWRKIDAQGVDKPTAGQTASGYFWRKYMSVSTDLYYGRGYVPRKWVLFRTGELYLNYAEAQNEALGPDATVYSAVNAIRNRAGMPNLPAGLSQADMRSAIQHERRIEMAFESQRFWDVRRWKIAEVVDNGPVHSVLYSINATDTTYTYPVLQTRVFDASKHYFMPIPQSEMDKMAGKNPDFKQTTGW
ncbi:MAG TPA: RagB/SusD family nutrient uptake outer membrane protein [Puia sp.]|nr:RagB/SusD family nutrient uptake outer membrane protein [Puia sp.]